MMRNTRLTAATAATLLLAGCANTTFHIPFFGSDDKDKASEYAKSREAIKNRPLEVPPDLTTPEATTTFNVPGLDDSKLSAEGKQILQNGTVLPKFTQAHVESAGDVRWLVVNAAPEKVWPQARQFWIDQGFSLTQDDAVSGLLQTNWQEEHADQPVGAVRSMFQRVFGSSYTTSRIDQYRMRIERGEAPDTTEIYISHQGMEERDTPDPIVTDTRNTRWVARKPDPELEAAQLKQLLVRLGTSVDIAGDAAKAVVAPAPQVAAADASKPASSTAPDRATLKTQADGKRVVQLHEGFDRAWRHVGQALERAGYSIGDRDRSMGIYYVHSSDITLAKEDPSFWSKLAFWRSTDKGATAPEPKGPEYLVIVVSKDNETTIRAGTRDGNALPDATASNLMNSLVTELR